MKIFVFNRVVQHHSNAKERQSTLAPRTVSYSGSHRIRDAVRSLLLYTIRYELTLEEISFFFELCPRPRLVCGESTIVFWRGMSSYFRYALSIEVIDLAIGFRGESLDSIYCGIDAKEVEELAGKHFEYLEKVNIVPRQPPMSYLSGKFCHFNLMFRIFVYRCNENSYLQA